MACTKRSCTMAMSASRARLSLSAELIDQTSSEGGRVRPLPRLPYLQAHGRSSKSPAGTHGDAAVDCRAGCGGGARRGGGGARGGGGGGPPAAPPPPHP